MEETTTQTYHYCRAATAPMSFPPFSQVISPQRRNQPDYLNAGFSPRAQLREGASGGAAGLSRFGRISRCSPPFITTCSNMGFNQSIIQPTNQWINQTNISTARPNSE